MQTKGWMNIATEKSLDRKSKTQDEQWKTQL